VRSLSNAEIAHYLTWAAMGVLFWLWSALLISSYFFSQLMVLCSFVVIKVIIGVNLISYATRRRSGMEAREEADVVNDFGRDPIGEGKEEQVGSPFYFLFSFAS